MPFIPHTDDDLAVMLQTIGVADIDTLFDEIPAALRISSLPGVPPGLSEAAVARLMRKRAAIFKHESQKDKALFPGPDPREFWQRAEERNTGTALALDRLGLQEYFALEAFVFET